MDGTLPKVGTVCQTDLEPFDSVEDGLREDAQGRLLMDMNEEDKLLLSAIKRLSSSSSPFSTNFYYYFQR